MTRHVLNIDVPSARLVGTAHLPQLLDEAGQPDANCDRHRVGVLLINPGPAPRAGNSDLSVHICDALAADGFLAFRFDMPGVGDSPGSAPLEVETYWQEVLQGRNDLPLLDLLSELRKQFSLDGLIVGGLCAGAVTAIRCAEIDERDIAGLLLLEPNFRLTVDPSAGASEEMLKHARQGRPSKVRHALSLRKWLYFLTGDNIASKVCMPIRPLLLKALTKIIGHSLPQETNVQMVMSWSRVIRMEIPTLALTAAGKIEEAYCLRILDSVPPVIAQNVFVEGVPDTNHILTAGRAREYVTNAVRNWARQQFAESAVPSTKRKRLARDRRRKAAVKDRRIGKPTSRGPTEIRPSENGVGAGTGAGVLVHESDQRAPLMSAPRAEVAHR